MLSGEIVTLGELQRGPKYSKCQVKMNSILHKVWSHTNDYYMHGDGSEEHRLFILRDHNIFCSQINKYYFINMYNL